MKRLIFTILIAIACIPLITAQVKQGTILIDGSLDIAHSKTDYSNSFVGSQGTTKYTTLAFSPSAGYFIRPSWVVGAGVSYQYTHELNQDQLNTPSSKTTSHAIFLTPYIKKYSRFLNKLYLTSALQLSGGLRETESTPGSNDSKSSSLSITLRAGLAYFLSSRWGVSTSIASLGYSHDRTKPTNGSLISDSDNNSFYLNLDINTFNFGVQYYLRNKED